MAVFSNSFLSLSGQAERLKNIGEVFKIALNPFSKDRVTANISQPTVKAAAEFVANNPYTTAAVVAGAPAIASKAGASFAAAKVTTQAAVVGGGLYGGTVLATSQTARVATIETLGSVTPERIVKAAGDTSKVIENPSVQNVKDLFTENKGVLGAAAAIGAVAFGTGAVTSLANTLAIKENTRITKEAAKQNKQVSSAPIPAVMPPPSSSVSAPANVIPSTPAASVTPDKSVKVSKVSAKRKSYKRKPLRSQGGKWKFLFKAQQR